MKKLRLTQRLSLISIALGIYWFWIMIFPFSFNTNIDITNIFALLFFGTEQVFTYAPSLVGILLGIKCYRTVNERNIRYLTGTYSFILIFWLGIIITTHFKMEYSFNKNNLFSLVFILGTIFTIIFHILFSRFVLKKEGYSLKELSKHISTTPIILLSIAIFISSNEPIETLLRLLQNNNVLSIIPEKEIDSISFVMTIIIARLTYVYGKKFFTDENFHKRLEKAECLQKQ